MRIVYTSTAKKDLCSRAKFLRYEVGDDLAKQSIARLRSAIRRVAELELQSEIVQLGVELPDARRYPLPGTPFILYFRYVGQVMEVISVYHHARPGLEARNAYEPDDVDE